MRNKKPLLLCIAAVAFCLNLQAFNLPSLTFQEKTSVAVKDSLKLDKKSSSKDKKADAEKKPEKKNEYEELMKKKGTVHKGLFTVRHIENKWYFEVPDSLLGRYLLCVTRYTSVPQGFGKFSGEEVNEATVYFEKRDYKTMLLRAYVLSQIADEKDNISKTLQASTTDPIVGAFKIIGKNKDEHLNLIEVTDLFLKDNKLMTSISGGRPGAPKLGALFADRTFIDTVKVFPINIEVGTTRTYALTGGRLAAASTGSATLGMNTSIVMLPEQPMRKRLWDKRVGYFVNNFTVFSDEQHKTDRESFIARYRLEPKDKQAYLKGKLVEPIKPIVYYIDPATPKKWVPFLIKGIEDWNVAFEAAGFKNAIQAKEWPNDPNMSVDDARYCVLRYLPSEIENAYGPHVSDPRSGEIIESHICWYHNVMNLLTKWYMIQCGPLDKRAQTMKFDDNLMGELIRFVSSHEVGHTLGLRHNMGASYATPVEKLRDKAWVESHGHTVSIMDYARFNYVAQPEDNISEKGLFPRIGDYDKWAIKWGYQWRPEFKDEFEEKKALMTETTNMLKQHPELWFSGEGRDEDPRSQTESVGDDNMKASTYGIKNLKRVIAGLPTWTKQDNYQYDDLTEMYAAVRDQFNRYTRHVQKNIGGHYLSNLPGKKPVEVAPASKQLSAVSWIGTNVLETPMWLYPKKITDLIGMDAQKDIESRQSTALSALLSVSVLNKIYNDSFTEGADILKLDTYLNTVFKYVWKPLNNKSELQNKIRRTQERNYLSCINSILNPEKKDEAKNVATPLVRLLKVGSSSNAISSDATLYVLQHLNKVESYCKSRSASAMGINKLHYDELLQQIKLIKERRTTVK